MKRKNTRWHYAFYSAMKLELKDNKDDLTFRSEHKIDISSIRIDLLVITKSADVNIKNVIVIPLPLNVNQAAE